MTGYALLKTVHVLSVMLWIGGMAFAHFFLRPALGTLDPPQRLALMRQVLRRFLAAVGVAVLLIIGSGGWMIGMAVSSASGDRFAWPVDWVVMIATGFVMFAIYGHIRGALFKRLDRAVDAKDWPAGAAALAGIRRWVGINLAIGVALIAVVLLV